MARTAFVASFTRIVQSWTTKVDQIVVDVLNEFRNPLDIRKVLGASSEQAFVEHKEDSFSPHGDSSFLLDAHKIRVVENLPFFQDPGKLYFNTGGGKNPKPYVLDSFTDVDATLVAAHASNLQYLANPWEVFVPATGAVGVAFIQDNAVRSTAYNVCLSTGPSSGLVSKTSYISGHGLTYPGVLVEATFTAGVPLTSGYQAQIFPRTASPSGILSYMRVDVWQSGVVTTLANINIQEVLPSVVSLSMYKKGTVLYIEINDKQYTVDIPPAYLVAGVKYGFAINAFATRGTVVDNYSMTELL